MKGTKRRAEGSLAVPIGAPRPATHTSGPTARSAARRADSGRIAAALAVALALVALALLAPGVITSPATLAVDATSAPSPTPDPSSTLDPLGSATPDASPADTPTPSPARDASPTLDPSPTPTAPTDPPVVAPTDSLIATPTDSPPPSSSPTPTAAPSDAPSPTPTPSLTPTPTPAPAGKVKIVQSSSAPPDGLHRIDPGSTLVLAVRVTAETEVAGGALVETLPAGWTLTQTDGGTYDIGAGTITWTVGSVAAGRTVTKTLQLIAPAIPTPDGGYELFATFSAGFDQGDVHDEAAPETLLVAPRLVIRQFTLAQVSGTPPQPTYLLPGSTITGEPRFQVFRVRFEVDNPDAVPATWVPDLWFRPAGGAWSSLPSGEPAAGSAFYAAHEWIPNPGPGGGTMLGPGAEAIDSDSLGGDEKMGANRAVVPGYHSMGINPIPEAELPALTTTAIEYSVRATADAAYLGEYEFRLTDGSGPLAGTVEPQVWLGPQPALLLSPGQREGAPAVGQTSSPTSLSNGRLYPLFAPLGVGSEDPIHGPYTLTSDACGACHRSHSAAGQSLTTLTSPQYALCSGCHDGSGPPSAANLSAEYGAAPANDPSTRSYYQHDPTQVTGHTTAADDVFSGVSNRHAECADCHNPHRSSATPDASSDPAGWTISGRLQGASGVSVVNGPAGAAPAYTLVTAATKEYQLCLKCHSGYTTLLPDPTPGIASPTPYTQFELDKGAELNPNNLSYHPIEAPGRNTTSQMDASLAGSSPYKLWTFTSGSTIRCVNCHADSSRLPGGRPDASASPGDGSSLPVHASQNRGILVQSYRDRDLKSSLEAYSAADFALCYSCHAEAPFVDTSGDERPDSNFRYHGLHVSGPDLLGRGTDTTGMDTPGSGGGLATCSECHFRIHSTTFAVPGQTIDGQRLVNFAPDVVAEGTSGSVAWTAKTTSVAGTCTLTCHSQPHGARAY